MPQTVEEAMKQADEFAGEMLTENRNDRVTVATMYGFLTVTFHEQGYRNLVAIMEKAMAEMTS